MPKGTSQDIFPLLPITQVHLKLNINIWHTITSHNLSFCIKPHIISLWYVVTFWSQTIENKRKLQFIQILKNPSKH
jgi:hypothetical protein